MSALNTLRARLSGRRLARFYDAAGVGDRLPRVIVGLPPEGHHEIGAFAFAVAARRAGLHVLYLGANVPLESWLRTVRETAAPIVVLGVVTPSDVVAAGAVVDALRVSPRPPICLVGGPRRRLARWTADHPAPDEARRCRRGISSGSSAPERCPSAESRMSSSNRPRYLSAHSFGIERLTGSAHTCRRARTTDTDNDLAARPTWKIQSECASRGDPMSMTQMHARRSPETQSQ